MDLKKEFIITNDLEGLRLDQALSRLMESRSRAAKLIKEGEVFLKNKELSLQKANQNIKASYLVKKGERFEILLEAKKAETKTLKPYDFPVPVVYEDSSILVVDKPAGLVSHPACGHPDDTLINALIHKLNPKEGDMRPGLIHRLDKEVSGLLILSKTDEAKNFLAKQFSNRTLSRVYHAFCFGPFQFDEGQVETFIKRHPVDRRKFIMHESEGKKALTFFKILKKSGDLALVECRLKTGRTHQIRLHSRAFSRGIIGDAVYAARPKKFKDPALLDKIKNLNRVGLHAMRLTFIHPETKKEISFDSPLPPSLKDIAQLI